MFGICKRRERLVGVDIGSAAVKIVELDLRGAATSVVRAEVVPLKGEVFSNNSITKPDRVIAELARCFASGNDPRPRAVTAVPAPSVFVKKIQVPRSSGVELSANVHLEASNLVPHTLDAVRLDFQILGKNGNSALDVLLVAVKRDVLESFTGCLDTVGLETAIVDVDLFALQNAYEFLNPGRRDTTVAIVNVGSRYTGINIFRAGRTVFSGDLSIGGRGCTEAIVQRLGIGFDEAEALKVGSGTDNSDGAVREAIERWCDGAAIEINRQLGFFWGAAAVDGRIDRVVLSGGGAFTPGLVEAVAVRTELPCELFEPFHGLRRGDGIDEAMLADRGAELGVAVGLALRCAGDKSAAEVRV